MFCSKTYTVHFIQNSKKYAMCVIGNFFIDPVRLAAIEISYDYQQFHLVHRFCFHNQVQLVSVSC